MVIYMKIKDCVREIQRILINDFRIPTDAGKDINDQLKIILALAEKENL